MQADDEIENAKTSICQDAGNTINAKLDKTKWKKEFVPYYLQARPFSDVSIRHAISALSVDNSEIDSIFEKAKLLLNRDSKGSLGEAHLSFLLETEGDIVLTKAGWKTHPFEVVKGVDLIGVCLTNHQIVFVEVKTRPSDSWKDKTLDDLKDQLSLGRLKTKFQIEASESSYITVVALFKNIVRERNIELGESYSVEQDVFLRIGSVVTGNKVYWKEINNALPEDCDPTKPCLLILYHVEDLALKLVELAQVDLLATRKEAKI